MTTTADPTTSEPGPTAGAVAAVADQRRSPATTGFGPASLIAAGLGLIPIGIVW
ncbi:hypothetical protein SAMN05216215_103050 [Saccharopolyspora shandongensis]|uniref:Uncharacterized protein n=1 Tax=Saccharopolyspora shandongensis TaxID=418495 RepID=A0A1H3L9I2_9PSEU|nr:hypothetical protein [Saccharopolyspora shandongensis]SDY60588.1 hypothetical protein SAMN05216215_103050 [Saccharopolyspora shandongensis]